MHVTPPAVCVDPVTVVLADYGHHASVVLPRIDGQSVEFAFGQWEWFAKGNESSGNALRLVAWPSEGTLATRVIPADASVAGLQGVMPVKSLQELHVERSSAAALRESLQAEYDAARATETYRPAAGLSFVKARRDYSIAHTCNHAVVEWLIRLGCDVWAPLPGSQAIIHAPKGASSSKRRRARGVRTWEESGRVGMWERGRVGMWERGNCCGGSGWA